MKKIIFVLILTFNGYSFAGDAFFNYQSTQSGNWSNPATWTNCAGEYPGEFISISRFYNVLIQAHHTITLDLDNINIIGLNAETNSELVIGNNFSSITVNTHQAQANEVMLSDMNLTINISNENLPQVGDSFTLINNETLNPIVGIFKDQNEGDTLMNNSMSISYIGGDGNDVVLANGNTLTLQNNKNDTLIVNNNGQSSFAMPLNDHTTYSLNILNQPSSPNQLCGFENTTSGMIDGGNVTGIIITCETIKYFIGVSVSGLLAGNYLLLQNNKSDDLIINDNGIFLFSSPIEDEQSYSITIALPAENPIQPCQLSFASGTLAGGDMVDVELICQSGDDLIYRDGFENTFQRK